MRHLLLSCILALTIIAPTYADHFYIGAYHPGTAKNVSDFGGDLMYEYWLSSNLWDSCLVDGAWTYYLQVPQLDTFNARVNADTSVKIMASWDVLYGGLSKSKAMDYYPHKARIEEYAWTSQPSPLCTVDSSDQQHHALTIVASVADSNTAALTTFDFRDRLNPDTSTNAQYQFEIIWKLESILDTSTRVARVELWGKRNNGDDAVDTNWNVISRAWISAGSFPGARLTIPDYDTLHFSNVVDRDYAKHSWIQVRVYSYGTADLTVRRLSIYEQYAWDVLHGHYDTTITRGLDLLSSQPWFDTRCLRVGLGDEAERENYKCWKYCADKVYARFGSKGTYMGMYKLWSYMREYMQDGGTQRLGQISVDNYHIGPGDKEVFLTGDTIERLLPNSYRPDSLNPDTVKRGLDSAHIRLAASTGIQADSDYARYNRTSEIGIGYTWREGGPTGFWSDPNRGDFVHGLRWASDAARSDADHPRPLWGVVQVHGWCQFGLTWWKRPPTAEEIKGALWIWMCFGANSILFSDFATVYGYNKVWGTDSCPADDQWIHSGTTNIGVLDSANHHDLDWAPVIIGSDTHLPTTWVGYKARWDAVKSSVDTLKRFLPIYESLKWLWAFSPKFPGLAGADSLQALSWISVKDLRTVQPHVSSPYVVSDSDDHLHWNCLVGEFQPLAVTSPAEHFIIVANNRWWPDWNDSTRHRDVRIIRMAVQQAPLAPHSAWRVTNLRTGREIFVEQNEEFSDTVLPADFIFLKVTEAYSTTAGVGDETIWNNGRRMAFWSSKYHTVFKRGTHCYLTASDSTGIAGNPPGKFAPEHRIDTLVDSAKHPCVRADDVRLGVVYEGRDSTANQIRIAHFSSTGLKTMDSLVRSYTNNPSFEATPVLCPFKFKWNGGADSAVGWVIAWSEGSAGIGLRTFDITNTQAGRGFGPITYAKADPTNNMALRTFPTISERFYGEDSIEFAFGEPKSAKGEIWSRRVRFTRDVTSNRFTPGFCFPAECVSCKTAPGCSSLHPSIDVTHTGAYGYAPRLAWETQYFRLRPGAQHLTSMTPAKAIFTASRIDTGTAGAIGVGWTNYVRMSAVGSENFLPSARVYASDSILNFLSIIEPALAGSISVNSVQPAQVGWYTDTKRLVQTRAPEGLIWDRTAILPGGIQNMIRMSCIWQFTHWKDPGTGPTLELNGIERDSWAHQRAFFISPEGHTVRIPLDSAYVVDSTRTYATLQVYVDDCPVPIRSTETSIGVTMFARDTTYPVGFFSASDRLFPGRVARTDTFRITPELDTVRYLQSTIAVDTDETKSWLLPSGSIRYAFCVRSCVTDSVLMTVHFRTITASNVGPFVDSDVGLGSLLDSVVYLSVTAETLGVANCVISGHPVFEEYSSDDVEGFAKHILSGKRANAHPEYVNPIFVEGWPQPIKPPSEGTLAFTVPEADANQQCLVRITDMLGHTLQTLVDEEKPAGRYTVQYPTADLPSGMYIAEIKAGHDIQCKLIVVRK